MDERIQGDDGRRNWTPSQAIACLLKLHGKPVTLSLDELTAWKTSLPTTMTLSEDGKSITFSVVDEPIIDKG